MRNFLDVYPVIALDVIEASNSVMPQRGKRNIVKLYRLDEEGRQYHGHPVQLLDS
jgi:hypothetical protein